jgi:hypothetical protein
MDPSRSTEMYRSQIKNSKDSLSVKLGVSILVDEDGVADMLFTKQISFELSRNINDVITEVSHVLYYFE